MTSRHIVLVFVVVLLSMLASVPASAQEPYLGEIRYVAFNFAPQGWALCNGQILAISQNTALFSLLGTNFGGDGVNTFALPDMRGRVPIGIGQGPGLTNRNIGEQGGQESVALTVAQMPAHRHPIHAYSGPGNSTAPASNVLANGSSTAMYSTHPPDVLLQSKATTSVGQNQPHENMQPYVGMTCIIAMAGIYPTQN